MIDEHGRSPFVSNYALGADVFPRPARKPLFGRRRRAKQLTQTGWYLLLCVLAVTIGAVLAIAV